MVEISCQARLTDDSRYHVLRKTKSVLGDYHGQTRLLIAGRDFLNLYDGKDVSARWNSCNTVKWQG